MRKPILFLLMVSCFACEMITGNQPEISYHPPAPAFLEKTTDSILDAWHRAAAETNFENYFSFMAEDGVFIGTDATENWQNPEFREFSKPYFNNGKAWDFTPLERNIYFSDTRETAWFDELLDTHMGICRGSGVMAFSNGEWKIRHYVLSVTVPNENLNAVTQIKKESDSTLISKLQ